MDLLTALLDSWDRQCAIVEAVAGLVHEGNRHAKPSDEGWPLDLHLAHMHNVRRHFLLEVAQERGKALASSYADENWTPLADLAALRACLRESGAAVREAVGEALASGVGPMQGPHVTYDNPVLLLQHMVWHDGWHVGLIFLALRRVGEEPNEEWDEPNVWGRWRTETW